MGEWIKDIGKIHIGDKTFRVEINESEVKNGEKLIHIQSQKFRFVLTQTEFIQMGTLALQARENLKNYKEISDGKTDEVI